MASLLFQRATSQRTPARLQKASSRILARGAGSISSVDDPSLSSWARARIGVRTFDPIPAHRLGLSHRPGSVTPQKHTFSLDYFRSHPCRDLLKVAWEGAAALAVEDDAFIVTAARSLRAGEIVERGILRGIGMGVLDDTAPNPYVCKLGQDFLSRTGFPWGDYSEIPGPPFLASGMLMFYEKSTSRFNVEVTVKESPVEGFEFDAVCVEDIPKGAPLVRRVRAANSKKPASRPRPVAEYDISDAQVEKYIEQYREQDLAKAAVTGEEPQQLHADVIREHVEKTRSGIDITCDRTATLPHPMWGGFGVFACSDIKKGEIVEAGLHGVINGLDGDKCPYVFTWNPDGQRYTDGRENVWATGAGNAMFYNSDHPANCRMYRFYDHYRFLMVATKNIKEGEEVMHLYASSSWRKCFVDDPNLPKMLPVEEES